MKQGLVRYQKEKEEARRREEERLRLEAEELRRRLEEEDRKRRESEAAAASRKLEEEALAEAAAREAVGDHQTAELILEHAVQQTETVPEPRPQVPVVVLAPVVAVTTPKVRGVGFRQVAKWRMECAYCPNIRSLRKQNGLQARLPLIWRAVFQLLPGATMA